MAYKCRHCSREFKFVAEYDAHYPGCEFFRSRVSVLEKSAGDKKMLTQHEMYQMMTRMAARIDVLEKDVARLKINSGVKCRNAVMDALKSSCPPPLEAWTTALQISPQHLTVVFSSGIMAGIKMCLCDQISESSVEKCPLRSFRQKLTNVYTFAPSADGTTVAWRPILGDEIDMLISRVSTKFIKAFINWQEENADLIDSGRISNEVVLEYMSHIYGIGRLSRDKIRTEVKKCIFEFVMQDLV